MNSFCSVTSIFGILWMPVSDIIDRFVVHRCLLFYRYFCRNENDKNRLINVFILLLRAAESAAIGRPTEHQWDALANETFEFLAFHLHLSSQLMVSLICPRFSFHTFAPI